MDPRYYQLLLKKEAGMAYDDQDYLDLQVWFNLAWIDPSFKKNKPELKKIVAKARFFTEEEKHVVLEKQIEILEDIIIPYCRFYLALRPPRKPMSRPSCRARILLIRRMPRSRSTAR